MYALLIASNSDERAVLSLALQRAGVAVTTAADLERAMNSWQERPADLVLTAVAGDSAENVRRIRTETEVLLVMIVENATEELQYDLLENGADLVVCRPFSARLLIAQLRALLRRAGSVPLSSLFTLNMANLTLDPAARTVRVRGSPPRRLTHLMIHPGQILSPDLIVERVWGYSGHGDKDLVRGLVSRLRAKVESDPRSPRYILTLPGIGYSFDPQESDEE